MDHYVKSETYTDLMYSVIEEHEDLHWIRDQVAIDCLKSDKEKKSHDMFVLGECIKVQDVYQEYCPYDFLIVIYEANCIGLTDEQIRILMYHELLHVDMDEKNGEPVYKVRPHDIQDFKEIITQFGLDWAKIGR